MWHPTCDVQGLLTVVVSWLVPPLQGPVILDTSDPTLIIPQFTKVTPAFSSFNRSVTSLYVVHIFVLKAPPIVGIFMAEIVELKYKNPKSK